MKLLLLLWMSFSSTISFHEFKIGRYELRPNTEDITLFIQLDRNDFLEVIQEQPGCNKSDIINDCINEYIVNHFKLNFDGQDACFEYLNYFVKEELIEVTFRIGISPDGVTSIGVFNDMLLEKSSRQENIVYSLLNDKNRSFRMNKRRTRTIIQY